MPFLVPVIVGALLSIAFSAVTAIIGSVLAKKKSIEPTKIDSPDSRQRINLTETTAYIPVVYGKRRVGGSLIFAEVKNAYIGQAAVPSNGVVVSVDTRGDYLYALLCFCEGPIERVESILIDGVETTAPKFNSPYRVNLTLTWSYTEPSPITVVSYIPWEMSTFVFLAAAGGGDYVFRDGRIYKRVTDTPIRYHLYRTDLSNGKRVKLKTSIGGQTSFVIDNTDYGDFYFELIYTGQNGQSIKVGEATVKITQFNDDFIQSQDDNLTVVQDSYQRGAYVTSEVREGHPEQTALNLFLNAKLKKYSAAMTGQGLCIVGLRLLKHTKGPAAENSSIKGLGNYTAVIAGRLLYNPDTGETAYSTNPALCLRDYLTNTTYGAKLPEKFINDSEVITALNKCDELITDTKGGQIKRYVCNAVIDPANRIVDNIEKLLDTFNAQLIWVNGKFFPKVMEDEAIDFDFNESNIDGDISITQPDIRSKINKLKVRWTNPEASWTSDFLVIEDQQYIEEDGEVLESEIELDNVTDYDHAYFLGQILLRESRFGLRVSFASHMEAYQTTVGAVVGLTLPDYGYDRKKCRVEKMKVNEDGLIEVLLAEHNAFVYDLDTSQQQEENSETELTNPFEVLPPTNLEVRQSFDFDGNSQYVSFTYFNWYGSTSLDVHKYQVDYRPFGSGEWIALGTTQSTSYEATNLMIGKYEISIRAINVLGIESEPLISSFEVYSPTDVPPDVSNFRVKNNNEEVTFMWEPVPEISTNGHFYIRFVKELSGVQWTDGTTFEARLPGQQTSITLAQFEGTYMIKAVNSAGLESANETIFVYKQPASKEWKHLETNQADPAFSGTTENLVTTNGILSLDSAGIFDEAEGQFDDRPGLFDDGNGVFDLGTFVHGTYTDLGDTYTVKIVKSIIQSVTGGTNTFEQEIGDFDSKDGLFDGTSPINAFAEMFVRSTTDDPAGTPTWTDWIPLTINKITGRAFEFRLELITKEAETNISVSQMRAEILFKQRVESESIVVSTSGQGINYVNSFYQQPALSVVITNGASGDYYVIANEDENGFDITIYDQGDNVVSRNITYIAQGYGEKLN